MKVEKIQNSHVKLTFDVTPEEFEQALDKAFDKVNADVEVKGFRKGHCPRNVFEKKFGVEALYDEALNIIIPDKYNEALYTDEFMVVAQPKIDLDVQSIHRGEAFSFTATVAVKPEVTLGQYKGLEAKAMDTTVTEEEIDTQIKQMMEKEAKLEAKEGTLENGDTAVFDFKGFVDGEAFDGGSAENFSLEIGSGQFIPGFESQMLGMAREEAKDLEVTFPENYQAANLAGKPAKFEVKLHDIKKKVYPELTDDWVKAQNKDGIETVEAFKEDLKAKTVASKEQTEKNRLLDELVEAACKNAQVIIPDEMIDYERDQMRENAEAQAKQYNLDLKTMLSIMGSSEEQFEMQIMKSATQKVKSTLVIEQIAKEENFDITDEEVAKKLEEMSKQYNMPVEEIKKYVTDDQIKSDLKFQHALDLLIDSAKLN